MTTTQNFTRAQYLNNECTHEQYYTQFVTPHIISVVKDNIGINIIKKALQENENLNSIPLTRWDAVSMAIRNSATADALRNAGDYPTLAGSTKFETGATSAMQ